MFRHRPLSSRSSKQRQHPDRLSRCASHSMTLLVQTDGRVKKRKERRRELRTQVLNDAVNAALRDAYAEVDRIQAPLINILGNPAAAGPSPRDAGSPMAMPAHVAGLDGTGDPLATQPSTPVMLSDSRTSASAPTCMHACAPAVCGGEGTAVSHLVVFNQHITLWACHMVRTQAAIESRRVWCPEGPSGRGKQTWARSIVQVCSGAHQRLSRLQG